MTSGNTAEPGPAAEPVRGVLNGLRVIELGHFIAAPFATRVLADLGAEVIKVEPPDGDPARGWGNTVDGRSIWWSVHARNKKCVTIDLKQPEGREIFLSLVETADAVVENFRPGQLERWGLGFDEMQKRRPGLVLVRISGFGQTGPYRDKVAFGVIGEAIGGLRYLTGYPSEVSNLPPVRAGVSLGDSVAALYGVIGLLGALFERSRNGPAAEGRCVDVALYESVFSLLEGSLPEYGRLGIVRQPAGSEIPTAAPSNTYRCADNQWVCIAGNSDRIFARLMATIGRPELADDARFAGNAARIRHRVLLDDFISGWTRTLPARDVEARLDAAKIPASRIYTIADCASDPHFKARGMIADVSDPHFGSLLHPGVVPQFAGITGAVGWPGPDIGAHNADVFGEILGLDGARLEALGDAESSDVERVEIVEVGPRDGFQLVAEFIPTSTKIAIVRQLFLAGFRRIEVGSFVSPKAIPQMRDAEAVLKAAVKLDGLRASVLVPNRKGVELAIAAGAREVVFVCSASEAHNLRNVRQTVAESIAAFLDVGRSLAMPGNVAIRLDVSTAFDCPFTGRVPEAAVFSLLDRALEGLDDLEIALCDTTGRGTPDHVRGLFEGCLERYRSRELSWAFHAHDTYGMAIANVVMAYAAGIRTFDASVAGLGGCPFAPGATGNVASEDVVYLFERMGIATGIDLTTLLPVADEVADIPGAVAGGHLRGVPRERLLQDQIRTYPSEG